MISKKLIRSIVLSLTLGFSSAFASHSVPMHFDHVSLKDGLSQNNIQYILQDSRGYMWFATESGLNRYDGYDIHRYSRERGNPSGFANDFVWVIAEDSESNLWLATQGGGVVRWNRNEDSFKSFRHDPNNPDSLASDDIRTLLLNPDGTLWVGTRDKGLDLLDPVTGKAQHFQHDAQNARSLANNMVYSLHRDESSHLWVGTDGGLSILVPDSTAFVNYSHEPGNNASLSENQVRAIYTDSQGATWVGTSEGGLNRFDRERQTFERFLHSSNDEKTISDNHIRVIFEDDAERLWVGTADGLNLLNRSNLSFDRYVEDPADPLSIGDSYINSMYQDRSGLIWIGTRSAGLSIWNPRSWSLGHKLFPGLQGSDITSFAANRSGEYWVGALGAGLALIDEKGGETTRYQHNPDDANSISDDKVMSLHLDGDGHLWVGTMTGGLNRINTRTGDVTVFRHDPSNPNSLAADGVMTILEAEDGKLWIGTYGGGVSILDKSTGLFTTYTHNTEDPNSLSDARASAIAQDHDGVMWVGTFGGGLNRFDAGTQQFQRYENSPTDPSSLADDTIYALNIDAAGNIWIGTGGGGLDRVVIAESGGISFRNYSQNDGLPSNVIYGIESDASFHLWLSTNFGLARLDPSSGLIDTFHEAHGLQGEEFNYAAHHRGPDGTLYFGGVNGFNAFNPALVLESEYVPPIVLTSFRKQNQLVDTVIPYDQLSAIELGYQDDVVSFDFAALDFTEPSQNTYAYMLEGFDTDWIDLGNVRHVSLTNLDAGDYVLKIKAVTSYGVETSNEYSIPINVAPAPWNTQFAYSIYVVLALSLLWLVAHLNQRRFAREAEYSRRLEADVEERTRQLEERNHELQIASRAKSDFLARMSHEIRTPMNGMMGMTQLLMGTGLDDKQYRFSQTIKRSCESLLEIINDILDFSKIEAGRLELDETEFNVNDLVDEAVELFSGAASDKGIELMAATPAGKTIAAVGDPLRVKQVLVNLLGNAVKFTQDGEIVLRCNVTECENDSLDFYFEVIDTGVGIHPDNLSMIFKSFSQEDGSTSRRFGGTGLGLAICKQLVEMMGGEIGVDSKQGHGSRFWFTVRLPKAGPAWLSRNVSFRLANLNVLLVDNNSTNSDIVTKYLTALGVRSETVASGSEGLRKLEEAAAYMPFDLVLVNSELGDMSGTRMAKAIRENPRVALAKIVLMTPPSADIDESVWSAAGIDDCLPKPIRQSMLYESLLVLSASSGMLRARKINKERQSKKLAPLSGNVLLVEDNPVNQAVALGMLEELGCEAVVAINGKEAVERVRDNRFDIVLMDCEMPVMDGFQATREIRDLKSINGRVPIIALTANAVDGDKEKCLSSGMQDYMSKPITVETLHTTLSRWLLPSAEAHDTSGELDSASLESIRNLKGVGGDKMVRRVVQLYLSNSQMLVDDLRSGLLSNDAERVRQAAHALKSSSQNVGAQGLVSLGQELEELGRSGQLQSTQAYVDELDALYPKTVEALKRAIQQVQAC